MRDAEHVAAAQDEGDKSGTTPETISSTRHARMPMTQEQERAARSDPGAQGADRTSCVQPRQRGPGFTPDLYASEHVNRCWIR